MLISLIRVSKSFGTHQILSDVSCAIEKGDRIALIGPNGVGKSTFLKIIAKEIVPDNGEVWYVRGVKVVSLNQERDLSLVDREQKSVGESRRTALESAFAQEADVFLLDEPTNNLDIHSLQWLEKKIQNSTATFVFVSHDRAFLDTVANKIFTIEESTRKLHFMNATYSEYIAEMQRRHQFLVKTHQEQQEELARLNELVRKKKDDVARGDIFEPEDNDKFAKGFFRNRTRGSAMKVKTTNSRIDKIEKIERPKENDPLVIPLDPRADGGTLGIELLGVVYMYPSKYIVGPCTLRIDYGQRVGVVGKNGSGKSTLLKLIAGDLVPDSGTVVRGSHCRVGNLMQEYELLPQDKTPIELIELESDVRDEYTINLLKKFGISYRSSSQSIRHLSPGLRARLLLALYSARSVNVLILDEPTNNLDIDALRALEELLELYTGTIILVSHDRQLIKNAKLDVIYGMEKGKLAQKEI